jgi:hypothetical protein
MALVILNAKSGLFVVPTHMCLQFFIKHLKSHYFVRQFLVDSSFQRRNSFWVDGLTESMEGSLSPVITIQIF